MKKSENHVDVFSYVDVFSMSYSAALDILKSHCPDFDSDSFMVDIDTDNSPTSKPLTVFEPSARALDHVTRSRMWPRACLMSPLTSTGGAVTLIITLCPVPATNYLAIT